MSANVYRKHFGTIETTSAGSLKCIAHQEPGWISYGHSASLGTGAMEGSVWQLPLSPSFPQKQEKQIDNLKVGENERELFRNFPSTSDDG